MQESSPLKQPQDLFKASLNIILINTNLIKFH